MPKISIKLNSESIQKALKDVRAYHKKVESAGEEIVRQLTETGVQQAKDMAMYMNAYDSGELVNGIVGHSSGTKGVIEATAPHSGYVEFGTGVKGEQNQHPNPGLANWRYDVNEHGEAGWWYWGADGKWHWSKGMPSRPFMYDTATILKQSVPYIAEEVMK